MFSTKRTKIYLLFYKSLKILFNPFLRLFYRVEIIGIENYIGKHDRGVIICSNHSSSLDPIVMAEYFPQYPMYFISKAELFKNRFVGSIFLFLNSYPVNRSGFPGETIKTVLKILEDGNIFAIYPEGTRSANGKIGEGRQGIGFIAYLSRAPIIPCAIYNSKKDPKKKEGQKSKDLFPKIKIIFGEIIDTEIIISSYSKREAIKKITDTVMENIRMLYLKIS